MINNICNMTLYNYIESVVKNKLEYTDCDGCTRAVAYLLSIAGIEFKIWEGKCIAKDDCSKVIPLHYWIEDNDGFVWDFKSYKWIKRDSHECNYITKCDVTETFDYGSFNFKILIDLSSTVGKKQDMFFEKITKTKLHRNNIMKTK